MTQKSPLIPTSLSARSLISTGLVAISLTALAAASPAHAHKTIAKDHAPIGVMGDHLHKKGEVMVSFRYMHMDMGGNRIGTDSVSAEEIVTTVPNRFAGAPGQPPTLRVVPTDMRMDMYMVGAMYGLTDRITLMAMGMVLANEMDHITFAGPAGTTRRGDFQTGASGFGDTKLAALVGIFDSADGAATQSVRHRAHLNLGLSLPTGSIDNTDQILTPMGTTPSPRLPYPMQLGSGTVDLEPGVTYNGSSAAFSWGAQYRASLRAGNNEANYTLGDAHRATAWAQWGPAPWISLSLRGAFKAQGSIEGRDLAIAAPVQTANPDFQGGDMAEIGFGVNLAGQSGAIKGHRLAAEFMLPVYQDLNGPQLENDWALTLGWQKMF